MIRKKIKVTASEGLHARPAASLVKFCSKLDSDIKLSYESNKCNAKSMMALLKMGIKKGAEIELEVQGGDEKNNMDDIIKFFSTQLN